jgi:hypothetical protein
MEAGFRPASSWCASRAWRFPFRLAEARPAPAAIAVTGLFVSFVVNLALLWQEPVFPAVGIIRAHDGSRQAKPSLASFVSSW